MSSRSFWRRLKAARHCWRYPGKSSSATYMKYPKESNFQGRKVLNLGCGSSVYPAKNVTNLDFLDGPGINTVWDLSKTPLPFEDNTFDFIIANHVFEHVPNWFDAFQECARILKPGGILEMWGPGDNTKGQLGYRDHINVINETSLYGVKGTIRNAANIWEEAESKRLTHAKKLKFITTIYRPMNYWWLQILPDRLLNWCTFHLCNTVAEMCFMFRKEKGE